MTDRSNPEAINARRAEILAKAKYQEGIRDAYVKNWGFDPVADLKPGQEGVFSYETRFALIQDPSLAQAGIEVVTRVGVTTDAESRNRILFVARDGKESAVDCDASGDVTDEDGRKLHLSPQYRRGYQFSRMSVEVQVWEGGGWINHVNGFLVDLGWHTSESTFRHVLEDDFVILESGDARE